MAKRKAGKNPEATNVEDLDVREVSVVDKPAIKRTFLIVKSEDGLEVIRQEEDQQMASKASTAENLDSGGILNLLDLEEAEGATEGTEISKTIDQLMVMAESLKAEDGESISDDSCQQIIRLAEGITGKPVDKAETAKLTPQDAEARVTKAVGQLMIVAKKLEDADSNDGLLELGNICSEIAPLEKSDEVTTTQDQPLKIFVASGGDDPEIIIQKAGAKMKRSRLSMLEKAVNALVSILNEIKGDQSNKDGKTQKSDEENQDMSTKDDKDTKTTDDPKPEEKVEPTVKDDGVEATATFTKDWMEGISKGIEAITAKFEDLTKRFEQAGEVVADLSKKVDDMEGTIPDGNSTGDPEHVDKAENKKSFWGGRILQ
jgi:hypothetical protein